MEKIWSLTTWSPLSERNTNRSDTMWSCCLNCGKHGILWFSSVHSVKSNPCGPMDCSTSGFPVHHQPPEFAQTHVHQVSDAIQPYDSVIPISFCLQSFSASRSFPMSQLFESDGQSIAISASASVLPMNVQD